MWASLEDELHEAENGDLLAQLALVRDQGRLRIESGGMLGAQGVVGVQIAMVECFQHLPQPCIWAPAQRLHLRMCSGGNRHRVVRNAAGLEESNAI